MPAPHPAVELRGLGLRYGAQAVLSSLDLEVAPGRTVVLCGANGAGKTSLLRVLATRLRPSAGTGRIFGFDLVREAHEARRHLAYLSVLGGHYPALSALENLRLAAGLYRHDAREVTAAELEGKLGAVGLLAAKDKLVRAFSSGMKKRLGVARLLLSDADLWLLDEPYAALDAEGQRLIDDLLVSAKLQGRTVVMASHEVEHSAQFADGILQLEGGLLRRFGTLTTSDVDVAHD
jgi:heme ABC exporter ATP-binding subunit CcmA